VTDQASKQSSEADKGPRGRVDVPDVVELDDEALVDRVQRGDRQAFGVLIGRYQDRVFNLVFRMCGRRAEAEELAQEAFLKAMERIGQFEGRSRFYTWLFRIAANLTISHRRRGRRVRFQSIDGWDDESTGRSLAAGTAQHREPNPARKAMAAETQDIVASALDSLDETFRVVLVLRDMQDMDYAEIADVLGVPVGTVKSRLFRARRMLRQRLEHLGPPE
jgi:RNA polymerase sigma-70 factor (ECF subfamily)